MRRNPRRHARRSGEPGARPPNARGSGARSADPHRDPVGPGSVRPRSLRALDRIAAATTVGGEVRDQAALLSRCAPDETSDAGARADEALGVIEQVSVLGRSATRAAACRRTMVKAPGASFRDPTAYSWGAYEVLWRAVPRTFATASGVPLDVFVHPRKESCTWIATRISLLGAAGGRPARVDWSGTPRLRRHRARTRPRRSCLAALRSARRPGTRLGGGSHRGSQGLLGRARRRRAGSPSRDQTIPGGVAPGAQASSISRSRRGRPRLAPTPAPDPQRQPRPPPRPAVVFERRVTALARALDSSPPGRTPA